jgi:hypothetical protein
LKPWSRHAFCGFVAALGNKSLKTLCDVTGSDEELVLLASVFAAAGLSVEGFCLSDTLVVWRPTNAIDRVRTTNRSVTGKQLLHR